MRWKQIMYRILSIRRTLKKVTDNEEDTYNKEETENKGEADNEKEN